MAASGTPRAEEVLQTPTRPLQSITIHQNAIICAQLIDCSHESQDSDSQDYLLLTGGDDNALAFTRFSSWSQSASSIETSSLDPYSTTHTSTLLLPRAHAAAVRAIAVKRRRLVGSVLELEIVTASNDQRLKTWHVRLNANEKGVEGLSAVKGKNLYTAVADIAGVDVVEGMEEGQVSNDKRNGEAGQVRVVVCGVGMDVR